MLFVTKLKAIKSITDDYEHYKEYFHLDVINYESIHKIDKVDYDLLVLDEAHAKLAGFPKPSKTFKEIKSRFSKLPVIFLSGTPIIESSSKIYHQLNVSENSPFNHYKNFYKWFKDYWIPKTIYTSYGEAISYDNSKYDLIMSATKHLFLTYTQKEAGFTTEITEHLLYVKMKPITYSLIERLKTDRIIESKDDAILADTGVKLQICLSELFSWTLKLQSWKAVTIDDSKWVFIKEYFKGKKIAIMYCFIQEKELLKTVFGDTITDDLEEFKTSDKNYFWQIVANREGISLKEADALVFYNIAFSWTSWTQGRDRMSYLWREKNDVYVICSEGWIEEKIYKVVKDKKTYSEKIFTKDFKIWKIKK